MATSDPSRRRALAVTVKVLVLVGLVFASAPFIAGVRGHKPADVPVDDPRELALDISSLGPGDFLKVPWQSGELWVHRRTAQDLAQLDRVTLQQLRDPDSRQSSQPATARNAYRAEQPEYFVFLPYETRRGCQVRFEPAGEGAAAPTGAFVDPCTGARFDLAGRILAAGSDPDQHNLRVPAYRFTAEHALRVRPGPAGGAPLP